MDLIYADVYGKEEVVLKAYELDLSYGKEENDFELTMPLSTHCLLDDYRIAVIDVVGGKEVGTEYGGIVDAINPDAKNNKVVYKGRTWHGILENRIIEPEAGYDYLLLDGDANECLKQLVDILQLSDIFVVETTLSGIEISSYQMERYVKGYTGIKQMLAEHDAKLQMVYRNKKVHLSAVPLIDYSQDEEFDTDQVDCKVGRTFNTVNHIICAGQGDLSERYVIHIFTDENGGVQQYLKDGVKTPLQDSDYILDKSKQLLFGTAEITELRDDKSVDVTENYILLIKQPAKWAKKFAEYYEYDEENDRYVEAKGTDEDVYTSINTQPSDWEKEYDSYYFKDDDGEYKSVEADEVISYKKLTKRPKDWTKNYDNYYYVFTDGIETDYRQADGVTKYKYKKQTRKPTDWADNYSAYYQRKKKGGYETISASKNKKAPKWVKGKYFTRERIVKPPSFGDRTYYSRKVTEKAPAFIAGSVYKKTDVAKAPKFVKGKYYKKVLDHYAVMVAEALEYIQEKIQNCDTIDVDLDASINYDIGDLVGATERVTGISVIQPITQKIVTINGEIKRPTIRYEVGY